MIAYINLKLLLQTDILANVVNQVFLIQFTQRPIYLFWLTHSLILTSFAEFPAITLLSGKLFVTTALAPITQPLPTVTPSQNTTLAPIQQLFPTLIPFSVIPCSLISFLLLLRTWFDEWNRIFCPQSHYPLYKPLSKFSVIPRTTYYSAASQTASFIKYQTCP